MRQFLIVPALILLAWCGPTAAQFKATGGGGMTFGHGNFECGVVQVSPRDNDPDPIYKINISVGFLDGEPAKLDTMTIVHASVDGKIYPRSDQYSNDKLFQVPGKLEVTWQGHWKKNTAVVMNGRIWNDANNRRWFYSEDQYKNGRQEMHMLSICHLLEPND